MNIPSVNDMQISDATVETKVEQATTTVSDDGKDNVDNKPVIANDETESVKPDSNGNFAIDDNENLPNKKCFAHNEAHEDITNETDDKTPLTNGDIATEDKDAKEEAPNGDTEKENDDKAGLTYKDDQWSPLNTEGKKQYDRDFLMILQTNPLSLQKPDNLPDNMDVILDAPNLKNVTSAPNLKSFDHPPIRSSASYQRTPRSVI